MELDEFVETTLTQILSGIRAAQKVEGGGAINAGHFAVTSGQIFTQGGGSFTRVDFDVALSAETSGGGKAGLKVFSVGAEADASHRRHHANRVSFSVVLKVPQGDPRD